MLIIIHMENTLYQGLNIVTFKYLIESIMILIYIRVIPTHTRIKYSKHLGIQLVPNF